MSKDERGRGREGEKHISAASCMSSTGDRANNPDMCPDLELNRGSLGAKADAQPTELHRPGVSFFFKCDHEENFDVTMWLV